MKSETTTGTTRTADPVGTAPAADAPGCPLAETGPDGALPPLRHWPAIDLDGVDFDPVLAELMDEGPVTRIQLPHGTGWAWMVSRYEDVRLVAGDPRFGRAAVMERDVTRLAPHFIPSKDAVGMQDPPHHTTLRRAVAPAFTGRGVERLRSRAQDMLDELVASMLGDGPPLDLTERLLAPFPLAVVCELMGTPEHERPRMHEWTSLILSSSAGADRSEQAKGAMCAYFAERLRAGGDQAGEDVVSLLAAAVAAGDVTEEEAVGLALLIQIGGEAVTNNTGNMAYILLTRPDLLARLRDDPAVRPRAIDELLRYIPHRNSVGLSRIALEDVTVSGVRIRAGDPVYVSYLAANRDPDVFPDPDRIDFDRAQNPHVSFGHGPHYCIGGLLARLESELVVDALADRFPGLHLAVPEDRLRWRPGALIRGPEGMPVAW
ncbi:Cytochrome P450 107B1 [Streptomyces sp. YIM 130001]|uniref:cytochrome P450 n=1 Tax=Streptomyces sp. YIM 130001 TaxID=2259644 RepID=UPI000E654367|nr:cytochrome P450 [Streptomyces sp. YIM 130001]RII20205.1 Cytochrome P450 107B1 [Streptomyces sp. YIM 130001]